MERVPPLRQLEAEYYFGVLAAGDGGRRLSARAFHTLAEMGAADYERLAAELEEADATASVLFLGRDADRYGATMADLAAAGHEVVLHGHRHVATDGVDRDLLHSNLTQGLAAIEDAAGITPRGYVPPGRTLDETALEVCADIGLDWVLGETTAAVPSALTFHEAVTPYDLRLLNEGLTPAEVLDRLHTLAEPGRAQFLHPNMFEYFDGRAQLKDWFERVSPVAVERMAETDRPGLVVDAARPLRVE
ncbi:MAG: polysaccharide deacetylase family protein [Salinirussus sp.]